MWCDQEVRELGHQCSPTMFTQCFELTLIKYVNQVKGSFLNYVWLLPYGPGMNQVFSTTVYLKPAYKL